MADRRMAVVRGRLRAVRERARRRPGWVGFAVGVVAGVVTSALFALYVLPILATGDDLEPGTLVILSGRDDSAGGQRRELINQWNSMHPRNQARIEELPGIADAQRSEMVARAQAKRRTVDVYNLDVTWVAEFAALRYIRPLDETGLDTSGFLGGPLATCRHGGKLWALPFNSDAGLLFYRTDLVANPPSSWAQLTGDVERVFAARDRDQRLVAGYTGQLAGYEGLTVNGLEAIWAAGGDVVDSSGRVVVDSPQVRAALVRMANGLAPADPQIVMRQSVSFDEAQSTQAFREGKVAFMRNWPVAYRTLDSSRGGDPAARLPYAVAKLPGPSVLGGQDLAVARNTGKPRAAQALVEFLTSERSQQILFERGGFAATRELVYRDSTVVDRYRYAPILLTAIRQARPRPVTAHYAQFSKAFQRLVQHALENGGELPPDARDRLADALKGYQR